MDSTSDRRDPVEATLFADRELGDQDADRLLSQYRILVDTSEALVSRRQGVNTFFLSVNSIILTVAALLLRDGQSGPLESAALIGLGLAGVTLCFGWRRLIVSFGQLNGGKFNVILALERHLPARVFAAEWEALGCGQDPERYTPFTKTEKRTPVIFGVLQAVLVLVGVLQAVLALVGLCTLSQ